MTWAGSPVLLIASCHVFLSCAGQMIGGREVRRGDERGLGVAGVSEQVGLAVEEARGVAADVDLGTLDPVLDPSESLRRAARRKARAIALAAQQRHLMLEAGDRKLGAEAGVRLSTKQQPHRAPVGGGSCELVQSAEVDVPDRDRERVLARVVAREVGEPVGVRGVDGEVVEQIRTRLHARARSASSAWCARRRSR